MNLLAHHGSPQGLTVEPHKLPPILHPTVSPRPSLASPSSTGFTGASTQALSTAPTTAPRRRVHQDNIKLDAGCYTGLIADSKKSSRSATQLRQRGQCKHFFSLIFLSTLAFALPRARAVLFFIGYLISIAALRSLQQAYLHGKRRRRLGQRPLRSSMSKEKEKGTPLTTPRPSSATTVADPFHVHVVRSPLNPVNQVHDPHSGCSPSDLAGGAGPQGLVLRLAGGGSA